MSGTLRHSYLSYSHSAPQPDGCGSANSVGMAVKTNSFSGRVSRLDLAWKAKSPCPVVIVRKNSKIRGTKTRKVYSSACLKLWSNLGQDMGRLILKFAGRKSANEWEAACIYQYLLLFRKVCFTPLHFTKDLVSTCFHLTERNPKRTFTFMKIGEKQKQHSAFVLQQALTEAANTPSSENDTAKLLPYQLHSVPEHQNAIALNGVCEHLCLISVYLVCSLARW